MTNPRVTAAREVAASGLLRAAGGERNTDIAAPENADVANCWRQSPDRPRFLPLGYKQGNPHADPNREPLGPRLRAGGVEYKLLRLGWRVIFRFAPGRSRARVDHVPGDMISQLKPHVSAWSRFLSRRNPAGAVEVCQFAEHEFRGAWLWVDPQGHQSRNRRAAVENQPAISEGLRRGLLRQSGRDQARGSRRERNRAGKDEGE